jgi:hypothetical protein
MTMKISLIALSFGLLVITPNVANGCSCGGYPSICDAFASADAVFFGSVRKAEERKPKKNDERSEIFSGQIAHVQVERVFKGEDMSEAIFHAGLTSCDPVYKEGQQWLFYAYYDKKDQAWRIRACDRSQLIEKAADDLLYLQALPASAQKTRISGALRHYENDPVKGFRRLENISGVKVKLIGGRKAYEAYTNADGVYEVYGLPPGRYAIQPEIPPGLKMWSPIIYGEIDDSDRKSPKAVLRGKSCANVDFVFIADTSSISGKVFGADGQVMPNVCLSLQPKDKTVRDNWLYDCTDKQGRYELREIPPGAYIIVANYHGKISSDEPFPTAYFPGVFEKVRAGVFIVANGDRLEDVNLHIPSQETRNVIQGVLLYSDGRPVADESVEFKAEAVKEGYSGEVHTTTDAQGRFSLNVLQGLKGRIYGYMYTYSGEYLNCPQLEKLIEAKGGHVPTIETTPLHLEVTADLQGVKLIFPFPYCAKAKRK